MAGADAAAGATAFGGRGATATAALCAAAACCTAAAIDAASAIEGAGGAGGFARTRRGEGLSGCTVTCAGGMADLEGGELASESEAALVHPSSEAEASAAGQRWPAGGTRLSEGGLASGIESLCGRAGPGGEAKGIALGQMYCDA